MMHSIIIPHRGRQPYLAACLHSIDHAAAVCPAEHEVIVSEPTAPMPVFNKPVLLNAGIDQAKGDVLTFLDCDAIVGERFLESVEHVDWPTTTRLCYRVRYLDRPTSNGVIAGTIDPTPLFAKYDSYRLGFEAYGTPERNCINVALEPWGNSQFSMTRERLGDLRFDEAYVGRGFEDLSFSKALALREGDNYHGVIMTDPVHAMFHMTHPYEPDWSQPAYTSANLARYKST